MEMNKSAIRAGAEGLRAVAATLALACAPGGAWAAGFYVNEQSAVGLGRGFAGETATGGDASALWYNPALAADFDRLTITSSLAGIYSSGSLENQGSTIRSAATGGADRALTGGDGGESLDPALVPQSAAVLPVGERLRLGLSVNAPFGLVTSYDQGWFGRYDSTRTELLTINVQGTAAYAITPTFAVGVGANVQYAEAVLESALPNLTTTADGFLQIKGNDWSPGWNVGATWRPSPELHFGAHYRSAVDHTLDGSRRISGLVGPLAGSNSFAPGTAKLKTPDIASLGAALDATEKLRLLAQFNWFGWSNFEEIRVKSPGSADLVSEQRYRDAVSVSLGAEHETWTDWTLRGGVMIEQTPTRPGYRTTRVPDSDRVWFNAGASWAPRPNTVVDVGAAVVLLKTAAVRREDVVYEGTAAETTTGLDAEISGTGLVFSLGATQRF